MLVDVRGTNLSDSGSNPDISTCDPDGAFTIRVFYIVSALLDTPPQENSMEPDGQVVGIIDR